MTIIRKLSDSPVTRWFILVLVSFTMLGGYLLTDIMAPLKPVLERELGWSSTDYGMFSGAFSWFNVFMLMIIFGGLVLDRFGIRFTGLASCIIMITGCTIKYLAISGILPVEGVILGINKQVMLASLGFALFGVGSETVNIVVTKVIAKWFKGKEIALAMGLQVAVARVGTMMALMFSLPVAEYFGTVKNGVLDYNESMPVLICLLILCIGMLGFFVYTFYDRKLDKQKDEDNGSVNKETFRLADVLVIFRNRSFWLIAFLCAFFYAAVLPYLKYATDLMINKYGVSESLAGTIPALLPIGTLIMTPVFGIVYDRKGYGASMMIIGAFILVMVHVLFALPILNYWWFATLLMILLGVAFSLVPSAMWPSIPKIIDEKQLGTAYSLIFWVQNWGLMGVPVLIGWVLDRYCRTEINGVVSYDYMLPMLLFAMFGAVALAFAFYLKHESKKRGYGLEKPNMVQ